jgi:alpha-L-rhamnosidase
MKIQLLLLLLGIATGVQAKSTTDNNFLRPSHEEAQRFVVEVTNEKVENMLNPLGLDTDRPRFSWVIQSRDHSVHDVVQTSYRIIVSSTYEKCMQNEGDLWDSGDVSSDQQLWVPYGGKPLGSNRHAYWKVRVKTNCGETPWSLHSHHFSTGLLGETQWGGRWIGLEQLQPGEQAGQQHSRLAARYLRKEFTLKAKPVRRATAFVAGLGLYQLFINGQRIGQDELTPLPSDYRRTIYYDTYNVTTPVCSGFPVATGSTASTDSPVAAPLGDGFPVAKGSTVGDGFPVAIALVLGNGRFFAPRQDKPYKNNTFGLPKCRLNVIVEYADGTTDRLVTDETWRITADGPIRANNEYDGEEYDARCELGDWTQPGYDDSRWQQAQRTALPTGTLRGRVSPNMVVKNYHRLLKPGGSIGGQPVANSSLMPVAGKPGTYIADFGVNMSGRVSLMPYGQKGTVIRLRYAERLNADGTLYTDNLRDARSEDVYVCSGKEQRSDEWSADSAWRATFVSHGFRYVEISGMKELAASSIVAEEVYDDLSVDGYFACNDTILNKVIANARRGIASNYKGMPVDCPQRNERQPWLGDRTVGALGESFLFDNERLYTKWMRDICEAQREDGCIPDVAPAFWNYYTDDVTWPAALPFICQMLYEQTGNDEALRLWYPNIKRWLQHIADRYTSKDGLITKDKYGDWCVPPERLELIHSQDPARKTDGTLIATAYTIGCMQIAARFARYLGLNSDATDWTTRSEAMKTAFNRRFLTCRPATSPRPGHLLFPDSTFYGNNTATSNLLPLAFGICPDSLRAEVAKQVVENVVVRNKGHVSCGVIGISWLLRVLSDSGYEDVAWQIATQKTYPSWGYMAEQGATTIWELWNGDKADPKMNSGNHVMLLGDLIAWCYQHLAGITTTDHYRHIRLAPAFAIEGLNRLNTTLHRPYGILSSSWRKIGGKLQWEVTLPCNTTATLRFPDGSEKTIGSGQYNFTVDLPKPDRRILDAELITPGAPSCHASTIVETQRGDLVVAYFSGTYERHPDCNIYVNIKEKGSDHFGPAILAACGATDCGSGEAVACWNPVLFEMPSGQLWLFYKVGKNVGGWTGWLVKSDDGGRTWSTPEPLPQGFLGPVKNKPLLVGDKLVCGSSTEGHGWRFHVELLDLKTNQWQYVGPVESTVAVKTDDNQPHPIDCIQPSLLQLSDGRLMVLMRTHNARLATSYSSDGGQTWTPVTLSAVENNQSGTDAVTLSDGRHALIYNNFATLPLTKKGPRTPLSVALSSDDGRTWQHWLTLEDSPMGEYSYPAIIQGRDGSLHCVYTWRRQRIAYKRLSPR